MTPVAVARSERAALCDLLDQLGPDAPTLCEGWRTRDLAAHLALRERRPDAAAGLVLPFLAGYAGKVQARFAAHPYSALVELVRAGPPGWSPQRVGLVDQATNTLEFLVHHEDVRRARERWSPRPPDAGREAAVWARLRLMARLLGRRSPVGLTLEPPHAPAVTVKPGAPRVTMAGPPSELALYLFGRTGVADIELRGPSEAVDELRAVRFGI